MEKPKFKIEKIITPHEILEVPVDMPFEEITKIYEEKRAEAKKDMDYKKIEAIDNAYTAITNETIKDLK